MSVKYDPLSTVPGYAYTRSGAKSEIGSTGAPIDFAANVPGVVPNKGYWSRVAVTNYGRYSKQPSLMAQNNVSSVDNTVLAPDGTLTGGTVTCTLAGGITSIYLNNEGTTTYTAECFYKKGNVRWGFIKEATLWAVWFDLDNGVVGTISGTVSAKMTALADGWYRCSVKSTVVGPFYCYRGMSRNTLAYDAQVGDTIHVWQMQALDKVIDDGPIIVTTTAAATIGADNLEVTASLPNGDFIIWMAFTAGVLDGDMTLFTLSTAGAGSAADFFRLFTTISGNVAMGNYNAGGVAQPVPPTITAIATSGGRSVAMLRRLNGVLSLAGKRANGTIVIGGNSAANVLPAVTAVDIGAWYSGTYQLNGQVEGFYQRNGTFTDADVTSILAGA